MRKAGLFLFGRILVYSLVLSTTSGIALAATTKASGENDIAAILLALGSVGSIAATLIVNWNNSKQANTKSLSEIHGAHIARLEADNERLRGDLFEAEEKYQKLLDDRRARHREEVEQLEARIRELRNEAAS